MMTLHARHTYKNDSDMFRYRNYLIAGPFIDLQRAVERLTECDVDELGARRDEVLEKLDAFAEDLSTLAPKSSASGNRAKRRRATSTPTRLCLTCEVTHPIVSFRNQFTCTSNDLRWTDLHRVHKTELTGAHDLNGALLQLNRLRSAFPRRQIRVVVLRNRDVAFEIENETRSYDDWITQRERLDESAQSIRWNRHRISRPRSTPPTESSESLRDTTRP